MIKINKDSIINSMLDKISSISKTDMEAEELKYKLLNDFKVSFSEGIIKSKEINEILLKLDLDMHYLYSIYSELDSSIDKAKSINNFFYESSISRVKELNDSLDSLDKTMYMKNNKRYYIDNFRSINSFESDLSFYCERYGEPVPLSFKSKYVDKEEVVIMPTTALDNSLNYGNKISTANINIVSQVGSGFVKIKNPNSNINNAIDTSANTFWSETILSDEPISVSFKSEKNVEVKNINGIIKEVEVMKLNDGYNYGIDRGALCEIVINFESINVVNEISLEPYSKFPIKVLAIRYNTSDDPEEELIEIASIKNLQEELITGYVTSKNTIRFNNILVKNIYIMMVQEHYEKDTYVYNPNDLYKNEVWYMQNNIFNDYSNSRIFKGNYEDRIYTNDVWSKINKTLSKNKDLDISKIILSDNSSTKKTIKYEYNYGLSNVSCNNVCYNDTGIYVSKEININNPINQIAIVTDEVHQLSSGGETITDIEYYITSNVNASYDDWVPILPKNKDYITRELLQVYNNVCYLRFEADSIDFVYVDGITMNPIDYIINTNDEGLIVSILITNFDFNSIYTVSYSPNLKGRLVQIGNILITTNENFNGDNRSSFELSDVPCVDSLYKYCDIKIINKMNNAVYSQDLKTVINITDIENPNISYKNLNKSSQVYQYCTVGNKIIFNKEIDDNCFIEITYKHYSSSVRLKAIMRRNSNDNFWLSPILKSIEYEFDVF